MANIKFVTRTTNKGKLAKVHARLYDGREYDFNAYSGYMVMADSWSNKTQSFKPRYRYSNEFSESQARELRNNFEDLRSFILKSLNNSSHKTIDKDWLERVIHKFHNPDIEQAKSTMTLSQYIANFVNDMESGKRLNVDKVRYSPATIKNYKGFRERLKEYCAAKRKKFNFNDINLEFYNDFVAYFTKKNYSINTIGRHVKELKIVMRAARDEGFHNNAEIESRRFKVLTMAVDNIYLNETELKAMYDLDLSNDKPKELARDVFLVGCYTAQRYGDYSTVGENNLRKLASGETVIELKQQKTGNKVVIPARPEVLAILAKYDNNLPKTYEQKVNSYIKKVAEAAGIVEPIDVEEMDNGKVVKVTYKKCDLVKTHTARRSGATNMYLAKIPSIAVMKITGHKTEKEFMKYIKITEEETAMELMNHPYFSGK